MGTDSYRDKENNVEVMSHIQSAVTSKGEILTLKKLVKLYFGLFFSAIFFLILTNSDGGPRIILS